MKLRNNLSIKNSAKEHITLKIIQKIRTLHYRGYISEKYESIEKSTLKLTKKTLRSQNLPKK